MTEYRILLKDIPFELVTPADEGIFTVVDEVGETLEENAILKATALAGESGLLSLADDSGLEVDALDGEPGVLSARYAGQDATDKDRVNLLLSRMKDMPWEKRTARFRCVIAWTPVLLDEVENASPVCYADDLEMQTASFEGTCEGRIDFAPRGTNGFGYDPLFVPDGYTESFAELGEAVKNRLSHRAKALAKLKAYLTNRPSD